MTSLDIVYKRLINQQITGDRFTEPGRLIEWMGCIRAEDTASAKWAIGHRVVDSTERSIDQAFNEGQILRTRVLRPVWHFVSPADIRWMLALTAPKLKAFNKDIYQALGIDAAVLRKSKRVIVRALEKGQLTRAQLWRALEKENIHADELRLGCLLMDAELDGLICSGGITGQQFLYALLDQCAPVQRSREKEEYIAELTKRYFLSRGPATVQDFVGWSGLRPSDVRTGMELNSRWLASEVINGQVYWFDGTGAVEDAGSSLFLLPANDEWAVAYMSNSFFKPAVVIDGQVAGSWNPVLRKNTVAIEVMTPVQRDDFLQTALRKEAERYSFFLGKRLV